MFNNLDKLCMVLNYRENRENKIVCLHTLNFNGVQNVFINLHNHILFAKSFPVYREKQITRIIYQYQNCVFIYKQALIILTQIYFQPYKSPQKVYSATKNDKHPGIA